MISTIYIAFKLCVFLNKYLHKSTFKLTKHKVHSKLIIKLPVSPGPPPAEKSGLLFALDIFPWIDLNYNNIITAASCMYKSAMVIEKTHSLEMYCEHSFKT